MALSRYPRGSEWRRWDLHVHSPASALNAHFGSWDNYVDALEKKGAGVAVLGITDYCSLDGYKQILEYRKAGRLPNFDLILPNIEFRVTPELPKGGAINIHILISPEDPDHVSKCEQALGKLSFKFKDIPYACRREELIALGKAKDPKILDDNAAFKAGVNIFKPPFEVLREWYNDNGWLKNNSLVVVANGQDGASGLSKDSGFSAVRDEIYRFSHMVFSGNPSDRTYFLGQGSDAIEKLMDDKGSRKPCIHGSDAHDDAKLFAPDMQRYCWVKADPTFEGLRQLLHEPEDRVYIGPTPPGIADKSRVIDQVEIKNGATWFANTNIVFNPGLVAIIGEKGSGKTALADVLAFASGAWEGESSSSSFISKARSHLDGIGVSVTWGDGRKSNAKLDSDPNNEAIEVRYLSQDFVEQLCSQDFRGEKLVAEVENVVFSHIDETDRLDASSFQELRKIKTSHLDARRSDIRAKVSRLNTEIVRFEDEIALRPKKVAAVKQHDEAITAIDKQLPELQKATDAKVTELLKQEQEKLRAKNADLTALNKRKSLIGSVRKRATDFYENLDEGYAELESSLGELGLNAHEIARFRPVVAGKPLVALDKLENSIDADVVRLRGDVKKPVAAGQAIADIQSRIAELEKSLAGDVKVRERVLELQKQRQKGDAERTRLKREIDKIDTELTKALEKRRSERWKIYLSYFEVLKEEQKELEDLYQPLSSVIAEDASGAKSGFDLNVRQLADGEKWLEAGVNLLDQRKRSAAIGDRDFAKKLQRTLFAPWQSGNKAEVQKGLQSVIEKLGASGPNVDELLVSHATRVKLYDWLFSPEHVHLDYGLSYQGTDLNALSPGTRGIVLLVLYLAMDQSDRRPLIIDQPEGNLDNSSIFEALVPFLRRAKKVRQVILVTHNPNLVATTDADQVIVATATKEPGSDHAVIKYSTGSLEHADDVSGTRDVAVRLLEGGKTPFKIREGRWRIPDLIKGFTA